MVTTMVKPVFGVLLAYPVGGEANGRLQCLSGAGLGRAQPGFQLAEGEFDGVEIGRVGRQLQQASPTGFDEFSQAGHFVGWQVAPGHDHVAGHEHGAEHLLQVGSKDHAVDGPVDSHGRL